MEFLRILTRMSRDAVGDGEILVLGAIKCAAFVGKRCGTTWVGFLEAADSLSGGVCVAQFAFSRSKRLPISADAQKLRLLLPIRYGHMSSAGGILLTCLYLEYALFQPIAFGVANYARILGCPKSRFLLRKYGRYSDYCLAQRGPTSYRRVDARIDAVRLGERSELNRIHLFTSLLRDIFIR